MLLYVGLGPSLCENAKNLEGRENDISQAKQNRTSLRIFASLTVDPTERYSTALGRRRVFTQPRPFGDILTRCALTCFVAPGVCMTQPLHSADIFFPDRRFLIFVDKLGNVYSM